MSAYGNDQTVHQYDGSVLHFGKQFLQGCPQGLQMSLLPVAFHCDDQNFYVND